MRRLEKKGSGNENLGEECEGREKEEHGREDKEKVKALRGRKRTGGRKERKKAA